MILVDTSVWIDHFRRGNDSLPGLLGRSLVLTHPFVVGELALGNFKNRREVLSLMARLPGLSVAEHREVMTLVELRRLSGSGIGWIDAHLLTSCMIAGIGLWSLDRRLAAAANALGIAWAAP